MIGPWAKRDFLRMGVKAEKIVEWGYFVELGTGARRPGYEGLRILWGGRMLDLKPLKPLKPSNRYVRDLV